MSEKIVDVICFAHEGSGQLKIIRKKYVIRAENAREKIGEIMTKLLNGEIDAFTVSLRE